MDTHKKHNSTLFFALAAILVFGASDSEAARGRRVQIDNPAAGNWEEPVEIDFAASDTFGPIANSNGAGNFLPMVLRIGDIRYDRLWINENGFISLGSSAADTAVVFQPNAQSLQNNVIAGFYTDIETQPVTPGCGLFDGGECDVGYSILDLPPPSDPEAPAPDYSRAFRVTWGLHGPLDPGTGKRDGWVAQAGQPDNRIRFQLRLIDRSTGPSTAGDFDLEFNYDGITWEGNPSLVGFRAGGEVLDFSSIHDTFVAGPAVPDPCANALNSDDPTFDRDVPFQCNNITIEFRSGVPRLVPYTADLGLAVQAAAANAAENFSVTLAVTNDGPDTASRVTSTLDLPGNTTFVSASPASVSCAPAGPQAICNHGDIAAGATANATITLVSTTAGARSYQVNTTADQYDPGVDDNAASASVTVNASANLTITGCSAPATIAQNATASVVCSVRNDGPQDATNVVMAATLPASVSFVAGTGCSVAGADLTCTKSLISSGTTAQFQIDLNATAAGTANIAATVRSDQHDPVSDNTASANFTINAPPPPPPPAGNGGGGGGAASVLLLTALSFIKLAHRRARRRFFLRERRCFPDASSLAS